MDGWMDGQTDGHGETSISPYNFVAGGTINGHNSGIIKRNTSQILSKGIVNKFQMICLMWILKLLKGNPTNQDFSGKSRAITPEQMKVLKSKIKFGL